jgi:type II secretion system protein L
MKTLRVLLAAAPTAGDEVEWALFDTKGACVSSGRARPSALPRAERFEIVIAAARARIACVALPPMAATRVAGAAVFALEDQLAGPPHEQQLAVSPRQPDGTVRAVIVERSWLAAIADGNGMLPQPARIIAEAELAPPAPGWRWCASESRDGFVRRSDGAAFPVDATDGSAQLPPELAVAIAEATRDGTAPAEILVDAPIAEAELARWQRETGVAFRRGTPWRWHDAPPPAFAAALDVLPGARPAARPASAPPRLRLFAPALWIVVVAVALHMAATSADWAWHKLDAWQNQRTWMTLAQGAGIPPSATATPASARNALSQRYAELRHARGLDAPDDALPLLARTAPALSALPAGSVRSATFADSHWTLDLARSDATALAEFDARLRLAGVPALTALAPQGARVRIGALK